MQSFLDALLEPSGLTPHGFCLSWDPVLLWLYAGGNVTIALAYFSIPVALARFARRRRDLAFPWVFWLFAAFIFGCGLTHAFGVVTLWVPAYWLDTGIMVATAAVSVATAAALWPLLPRALALPSPRQLQAANAALVEEMARHDALARRLRESEARFRAFFEHATDVLAVLRLQQDGAVVFEAANPALAALLGQAPDAIAGGTADEVMPGEAGRILAERCRACAGASEPLRYDARVVGTDAREHSFEAILAPVRGRDSLGMRVMASLRDVTGQRELERQLAQSQKMEALGRLTGGVAHDFNNILMGVSGALQRILKDASLDARRAAMGAAALQSVERGARLVRHMLAFARRQPLEPEPVEVNALVASLAEDVVARTLGGTISVGTVLQPDLWPVLADRTQLEAALLNLAVNARDAMPEGGTLTVETANVRLDGRRGVGEEGLAAGDYVLVTVADTGSGMPPEVVARAFDPFFTTKPLGQGTGLGLSQVYGFARQSGGSAEIYSHLGEGTSVMLYLPRAQPRACMAEV